jgi:hypothetical protein
MHVPNGPSTASELYDLVTDSTSPEKLWPAKVRQSTRAFGLTSLIIVAGLIAACADDSGDVDDRRFANEPATEVATIATPTTTQEQHAAPTAAPLPSPQSLLHARGAPDILYTIVAGRISIIDTAQPGAARVIGIEPGLQVVDIASSPNGDRVAALIVSADKAGQGTDVVIFDQDGTELQRWASIDVADEFAATPGMDPPTQDDGEGEVTWAAEGDKLLVTLNANQLISIDIAGEATVIPLTAAIKHVEHAAWSPRGDTIAVLARDSRQSGVIWIIDPTVDGESAIQVVPPNADASNLGSVTTFSWLPDGSGFAYILAPDAGEGEPGGQLYTLNLKTGITLLVATAGRGGPAALIVDFALSPDGKSIAYTIAIPNGDQWQFDSLWIRSLRSSNRVQVPVGGSAQVVQVWWADPGIVWMQQEHSDFVVILKAVEGEPELLLTIDPDGQATPEATPEATPVAGTPGATPVVGSPGATPVAGTPGATPMAGTPSVATPDAATPAATPSD